MKFYELDLRQIIPYGIPLNTESHVEYMEHINDFFLQGFENYFHRFYTTDLDGELTIDYSRSCTAPNSLLACQFCTDAQLESAITGAGFKYYTTNTHAVNAKFMYDLNNIQFGTEGWLTAVAQYAANSHNVSAKPVYEGKDPYHYGIYLSGDIMSSANTAAILNRMIENLKVVGTAHTRVDELTIEDTSSLIGANAAVGAIDVGIFCEVEIPILYDVWLNNFGSTKQNTVKGFRDYFGAGLVVAKRIVDATPTPLSAFNNVIDGGPYLKTQAESVVTGLINACKVYDPAWDGSIDAKIYIPS